MSDGIVYLSESGRLNKYLEGLSETEKALLHKICEQPYDNAPKLVYTDWLEEKGREKQAEDIRLRIAGEISFEDALIEPWHDSFGCNVWTEDGFITKMAGPFKFFVGQAEKLFKTYPLRSISVQRKEPYENCSEKLFSFERYDNVDDDNGCSWLIPSCVFEFLLYSNKRYSKIADYKTVDDAMADLNRATYLFCRHAAGLPHVKPQPDFYDRV